MNYLGYGLDLTTLTPFDIRAVGVSYLAIEIQDHGRYHRLSRVCGEVTRRSKSTGMKPVMSRLVYTRFISYCQSHL